MIGKYSEENGKELIQLARKAIESKFNVNSAKGEDEIEIPNKKEYKQARGVFVTLTSKKDGRLRGCVGFSDAVYSLGEAVVKAARLAAFEDTRFKPLKEEELNKINIEISILTQPFLISGNVATEYEVGKDGLICECLGYRGLLLPQIAEEHNMDKIEFLESVCEKAGLPKDYWQNSNVKFYKFRVQSFKEE